MKNFVQAGDTVTVTAPGDVESGEVVVIEDLVGVAAGDADNGDPLDIVTRGVFELPKVEADVIAVGKPVYLSSGGLITITESTNPLVGIAVTAAGNPSGSVHVKIG